MQITINVLFYGYWKWSFIKASFTQSHSAAPILDIEHCGEGDHRYRLQRFRSVTIVVCETIHISLDFPPSVIFFSQWSCWMASCKKKGPNRWCVHVIKLYIHVTFVSVVFSLGMYKYIWHNDDTLVHSYALTHVNQ